MVGAASADGLLLWASSARLRDGHKSEEEEAHRGDGNPDEVVLVPMLLPLMPMLLLLMVTLLVLRQRLLLRMQMLLLPTAIPLLPLL